MSSSRGHDKGEVIVRLNSGLGNQLFQLAQGLSVADQRHARLRYDTTWFELVSGVHPVKRQLRLPAFCVALPEAFSGIRRLAVGVVAALFDKTGHGKSVLSTLGKMQVVQESPLPQSRAFEAVNNGTNRIYLNGYWQTYDAFLKVRNELKSILAPRERLSNGANALIAKARSVPTGFIHVRRGDYFHFMGDMGILPIDYYSRALAKLREIGTRINQWLIFSEDADWAKANLCFVPNATVIEYQSSNRDIEDIIIMRTCCAAVVANSSYSWWGGALGDRENRPVIAPDRYWRHSDQPVTSWALPHWIQVQAWD